MGSLQQRWHMILAFGRADADCSTIPLVSQTPTAKSLQKRVLQTYLPDSLPDHRTSLFRSPNGGQSNKGKKFRRLSLTGSAHQIVVSSGIQDKMQVIDGLNGELRNRRSALLTKCRHTNGRLKPRSNAAGNSRSRATQKKTILLSEFFDV